MLVQHFLPSTTATRISDSSFSPSSLSTISPLKKSKQTSALSPFFNSESTGFQPVTDQNIRAGCGEKIKTHLSAWPTKLTTVMEIHRQRFSQLNPRFTQQRTKTTTASQPTKQSVICPVILPSNIRPQPRQQARTKQHDSTHLPPAQQARRPSTALNKAELASESNQHYITLNNITKFFDLLQTQVKRSDNETSTDMSTSTTNSAKQRVQQHLQNTATRWWKPTRTSECQTTVLASCSAYNYGPTTGASTRVPSPDLTHQRQRQESSNAPIFTIVSNSTQQFNLSATSACETSKCGGSESSTEVQATTVFTTIAPPLQTTTNTRRTRQEPLIMQARGMRLHSHDHYYYKKQNNLNFLQQQRLIRQT